MPGPDPVGGQQPGHPVGGPVPVGEGQRPPGPLGRGRLDVGLDVGVDPGRGPQDVDQRGVLPLDLTRRHIGGDCTSGAGRSPAPTAGGADRKARGSWTARKAVGSLVVGGHGDPVGPGYRRLDHGLRRQGNRAPRPGGDPAAGRDPDLHPRRPRMDDADHPAQPDHRGQGLLQGGQTGGRRRRSVPHPLHLRGRARNGRLPGQAARATSSAWT